MIAIIRERTSKPVRHVINTHWHADHVQGDSVYLREFPMFRSLAIPRPSRGSTRYSCLANPDPVFDAVEQLIETGAGQ